MIAVVAISLTFFAGFTVLRNSARAKAYQLRALTWQREEQTHRNHMALCQKEVARLALTASQLPTKGLDTLHPLQADALARELADQTAWWRTNEAHTDAMIKHSLTMGRKYSHAAYYPWLSVEPDPLAPYWSGMVDPPQDE